MGDKQSPRSVRSPTDTYLQTQACVHYHHKFGSTGLWQQALVSSLVWGSDTSENETLTSLVQPKTLPLHRVMPEMGRLHPGSSKGQSRAASSVFSPIHFPLFSLSLTDTMGLGVSLIILLFHITEASFIQTLTHRLNLVPYGWPNSRIKKSLSVMGREREKHRRAQMQVHSFKHL